jgi:hypothetical protein
MYTVTNYKTKKELKYDFSQGKKIKVYQPNDMFGHPSTGDFTVEGPHYPKPHSWYARVRIVDFIITKILG